MVTRILLLAAACFALLTSAIAHNHYNSRSEPSVPVQKHEGAVQAANFVAVAEMPAALESSLESYIRMHRMLVR